MAAAPPVVVSPDTELQFVLSESEATPKCSMTISHPGGGVTEHIAFKVRQNLALPVDFTTVRMSFFRLFFHAECRRNCTARSKTKKYLFDDDHEDFYIMLRMIIQYSLDVSSRSVPFFFWRLLSPSCENGCVESPFVKNTLGTILTCTLI
jgi:hypothetical protein